MSENTSSICQQFREAPEQYVEHGRRSIVSKRAGPLLRQVSAAVESVQKSRARRRVLAQRDDGAQTLLIGAIPNLRAFANSLCGDPARSDDLVQETLVKAWSNLASFEKGTNLKAWLFTILRNTYFSELRKRRHEVEDADGAHAERMYELPGQQAHMDVVDFKKAFGSLGDDQKEALLLVGAEGFSYMEAAEITGVAIGTVKSRVNRARVALTKFLRLDAQENFGSNAEFIGFIGTRPAVWQG